VDGNDLNARLPEHAGAGLLHDQVTGAAVGPLDDDGARSVAGDALKHRDKARPGLERVGAAPRLVVELGHDLEAGLLGEGLDRHSLARARNLFGADVGGRARPQILGGGDPILLRHSAHQIRDFYNSLAGYSP